MSPHIKSATFIVLLLLMSQPIYAQQNAGGLLGQYYNGINFDYLAFTRVDEKIGFSRKLESPCPGVGKEYFSIRWSGKITPPLSGVYKFHVVADDGVRLWVNHEQLIDAWFDQEATSYSGSILLDGGQSYDIRIEYFNSIVHSVIDVEWEVPETEPGILFEGLQARIGKSVPISSNFLLPDREKKKAKSNLMVTSMVIPKPKNDSSSNISKQTKNIIRPAKKGKIKKEEFTTDERIILKTVIFDQQSANIPYDAHDELNRLIKYLKRHGHKKIEIRGHTDYAGDSLDNHQLSIRRAQAVESYLIANGIDKSRITSKGFGGAQPLIRKRDLEDRLINRRVEFVLLD